MRFIRKQNRRRTLALIVPALLALAPAAQAVELSAGDWKVDGWSADPGPTPMLDGTAAVATTEEIDGVVSWPLAGGA